MKENRNDIARAPLTASEQILDERDCAQLLGIGFDGLQDLRRRGEGPPYVRIGKGIVRYLRTRVVEWLDGNLISGPEREP